MVVKNFEDFFHVTRRPTAEARTQVLDKRRGALRAEVCLEENLFQLVKGLVIPRLSEKGFNALRQRRACFAERTLDLFVAAFEKVKHKILIDGKAILSHKGIERKIGR